MLLYTTRTDSEKGTVCSPHVCEALKYYLLKKRRKRGRERKKEGRRTGKGKTE